MQNLELLNQSLPDEVEHCIQIFFKETFSEILQNTKLAEEFFESFGTEWSHVEHTAENYANLTADNACYILKKMFFDAVNKVLPSIHERIKVESAKTIPAEFLL